MARKPRNPAFFSTQEIPKDVIVPMKGGKPLPGKVVEIPIMRRRIDPETGTVNLEQVGVTKAYRVDDGVSPESASMNYSLASMLGRAPTRRLPQRTRWDSKDYARMAKSARLSQSVPAAYRPTEDWQKEAEATFEPSKITWGSAK